MEIKGPMKTYIISESEYATARRRREEEKEKGGKSEQGRNKPAELNLFHVIRRKHI